ncbi:MAG: sigma-70 family RNA polymerase sigma factor [Ezakiella sp.]|nr:sigma-70 family RNA polymerase sigma factor [Ezakiella sp.]
MKREFKEEEITKIINDYRPLVITSIKAYCNYPHLFEDLISEGNIEMIEALNDYDDELGVPLGGYLKARLRGYYQNKAKSEKLRTNYGFPEGYEKASEESFEEEIINRELVEEIISILSFDERRVIELYYFNEKKVADIANEMQISTSKVYAIKRAAIAKMREFLE